VAPNGSRFLGRNPEMLLSISAWTVYHQTR
jgi:hypothetical protein